MKRFYKDVMVGEADGGYRILLDGRPVRTPLKDIAALPTAALAEAVAAEWRAQEEVIRTDDMPLTGLGFTALDHVARQRGGIIEQLAAYGETDLLCHFEDQDALLAERQRQHWQPLLDWSAEALGLPLNSTAGIMPVKQDAGTVPGFARHLEQLDDWRLTAASHAVSISGSIVLGLALVMGKRDAEAVYTASLLDELYQAERWGSDAEADARRAHIRRELQTVETFLSLLQA